LDAATADFREPNPWLELFGRAYFKNRKRREGGMLSSVRITLLAAVALVAGSVAWATPAAASSPIGPNQHFIGLVNGKNVGAVIYTVCPGPLGPGRTGPPVGNQTVAVKRVRTGGGDTGAAARVIFAVITPTTIIQLHAYGVPAPIPTTAQVPCDGTGTVVFSTCPLPQPCGAGARDDDVPVQFLDIAV
jgi:hypothetical protein